MRLTSAQWQTLRAGSVLLFLCGLGLAVFTVLYSPHSTGAADLTVVDDPTSFALPDLDLLGGEVVVYGAAESGEATHRTLDCRLLDDSGDEQNSAKMDDLAIITLDPITLDNQRLEPLFAVRSYLPDSSVQCAEARSVAPIAISSASTFGRLGPLVRASAGGLALVCLVVGAAGWFVVRSSVRNRRTGALPG